jgi:preprotein translocase subunit SecB
MTTTERSQVKCNGIALAEAVFRLKGSIPAGSLEGEYEINVGLGLQFVQENVLQSHLELKAINKKHPDRVEARVKVLGLFEGDRESLEKFGPNSGGILLPYARTYLATLTGWGPMAPVMAPIMNMTREAIEKQSGKKIVFSGRHSPKPT